MLGSALTSSGKRATGGLKRARLQQALVVAQVAVSVILLTGAGLLTRTMQRLSAVDSGVRTDHMLTMEVPHDFIGKQDPVKTASDYKQMQSGLAALPGVQGVGMGSVIPTRAAGFMIELNAEGRTLAAGEPHPQAEYRLAGPDYFKTSGISIMKGREFNSTDEPTTQAVVVLNKAAADYLFPGVDPLGRRIAWSGEVLKLIGITENDWRTVVGVVANTKDGGLDAAKLPAVFTPITQGIFPSGGFVIRASGDAAALAPAATNVIRSIAPEQRIEHVMTGEQLRDESIAPRRLNALLVGSFSILALIVAAIGIAAVLAFSVTARTNEIGIRMSLGADAGSVQRMVLSEGGALVGVGLGVGVAGSLLLTRLMQGLLFGVAANDPMTLSGVAVLMAAIGIAACWIPAARAARIDPGIALRAQ
jgi:putative ABC transport system permease protein